MVRCPSSAYHDPPREAPKSSPKPRYEVVVPIEEIRASTAMAATAAVIRYVLVNEPSWDIDDVGHLILRSGRGHAALAAATLWMIVP